MIPLLQRYLLLPKGIWSQISHSPGYPILIIMIALNVYLLKKHSHPDRDKMIKILQWMGIFFILYILFLPFGGYRPYRPRIIRYDTIMPLTMMLIFYFTASAYAILTFLKGTKRRNYGILLVAVLLIFAIADLEGFNRNECERAALQKMAASTERVVELPKDCYVLDWENNFDYRETQREAELILFWNITSELTYFYNRKQEQH